MTEQDFTVQVQRLIDTYSDRAFPRERLLLLKKAVMQFSREWFEGVVSKFIATLRQAPMLPDFYEESSRERERIWSIEKEKHAKTGKEFFTGSLPDSEIGVLLTMIRKRASRELSDDNWASAMKMLSNIPRDPNQPRICEDCGQSGVLVEDIDFSPTAYRCHCAAGRGDRRNKIIQYQIPQRRKPA